MDANDNFAVLIVDIQLFQLNTRTGLHNRALTAKIVDPGAAIVRNDLITFR